MLRLLVATAAASAPLLAGGAATTLSAELDRLIFM